MLHTSYVAWSVSVCSEHGWAVIKTAEPIEMPFVGWRMWVQGNNVLDGVKIGRIHSSPQRVTRQRCGLLSNYFGRLLVLLLLCKAHQHKAISVKIKVSKTTTMAVKNCSGRRPHSFLETCGQTMEQEHRFSSVPSNCSDVTYNNCSCQDLFNKLKTKTETLATRSRDRDKDLVKTNSSALEFRDLGLEITITTLIEFHSSELR